MVTFMTSQHLGHHGNISHLPTGTCQLLKTEKGIKQEVGREVFRCQFKILWVAASEVTSCRHGVSMQTVLYVVGVQGYQRSNMYSPTIFLLFLTSSENTKNFIKIVHINSINLKNSEILKNKKAFQ